MRIRYLIVCCSLLFTANVLADSEEPTINIRYVYDKYQRIQIESNTGQTYLNRKFVKGQSVSVPYKDSKRKKIKTFTLTLVDRQFELKTRCSSKQLKLNLGADYFSVQSLGKKPACIVSEQKIEVPVTKEHPNVKPPKSHKTPVQAQPESRSSVEQED